jgi:hypothetical protein
MAFLGIFDPRGILLAVISYQYATRTLTPVYRVVLQTYQMGRQTYQMGRQTYQMGRQIYQMGRQIYHIDDSHTSYSYMIRQKTSSAGICVALVVLREYHGRNQPSSAAQGHPQRVEDVAHPVRGERAVNGGVDRAGSSRTRAGSSRAGGSRARSVRRVCGRDRRAGGAEPLQHPLASDCMIDRGHRAQAFPARKAFDGHEHAAMCSTRARVQMCENGSRPSEK